MNLTLRTLRDKFSDDCVVIGNKRGKILIIILVFVWRTETDNENLEIGKLGVIHNGQLSSHKAYTIRTQ